MTIKKIDKNDKNLILRLFEIWKSSVLATHDFLSNDEVENIAKYIPEAFKNTKHLAVAYIDNEPCGFIGVNEKKIEMLFVNPLNFKQGIGKELVKHAFDELKANEVCVNEQNLNAIKFYKNLGFKIYKRSELDDQGNPYPILYMRV